MNRTEIRKGMKVYGATPEAQVPEEGAVVERVVWRNGSYEVYLAHLDGGGIGLRDPKELVHEKAER